MKKDTKRRLVLIGLDGMIPEMLEKFVKEGILPNLGRLMKKGAYTKVLPVPQTATASSWQSIATGTWAGTHGIYGTYTRKVGEPFHPVYFKDRFPTEFPSDPKKKANSSSKVPYFWDSVEASGKKCILLNYPGAWPPSIKKGIVINGVGACSSMAQLTTANIYTGEGEKGSLDSRYIHIEFKPARDWKNLPQGFKEFLETKVTLEKDIVMSKGGIKGSYALEFKKLGLKSLGRKSYYFLLGKSGQGYDQLFISEKKDYRQAIKLNLKEWSPWFKTGFRLIYKLGFAEEMQKKYFKVLKVNGIFKFKCLQFSKDGKRVKILRTPIYNTWGWAHPDSIALELIENHVMGIDGLEQEEISNIENTQYSRLVLTKSYEAETLVKTCSLLSGREKNWDLLFVQICSPDGRNHLDVNKISPGTSGYTPSGEKSAWERFKKDFCALDKMVGEIVKCCTDGKTIVSVVSDHGGLPVDKNVWLSKYLQDARLLIYKKDKRDGMHYVDIEKSKVFLGDYPLPGHIWINLKGRESKGIVKPGKEYEEVVEETIRVLFSIKDPGTGICPISLAIRKKDADFLGLWSEDTGDIIYFYKEGYMWVDQVGIASFYGGKISLFGDRNYPAISATGPVPEDFLRSWNKKPVRKIPGGVGSHCYLPTASYKGWSNAGIFILNGPGVKKGYIRKHPLWTVDIIPTLAHLTGFPVPGTVEGKIASDVVSI